MSSRNNRGQTTVSECPLLAVSSPNDFARNEYLAGFHAKRIAMDLADKPRPSAVRVVGQNKKGPRGPSEMAL